MADFVVGGKIQLDPGNSPQTLKELKQSIRSAKDDLIAMQAKFGETSNEARKAAQRVAEFEDKLGDAKQLVDAFNPDQKFRALGQSLNGVLGGFTALTGAMGLLGVESEEVQKQLLKVQSALALSQGLNQIGGAIQSFKNLGQTLVSTFGKGGLIGIAIAGVAALGAVLAGLFKKNKDLIAANEEYAKGLAQARNEIYQVTNAIDQAKRGIISKKEALDKFNNTIGETVGKTDDLNEAEQLLKDGAAKYIQVQGLKAKANLLLQKSAEASTEAELLRLSIQDTPGFARGELGKIIEKNEKRALELLKLVNDINKEVEVLTGGGAASRLGATAGGAGGKGNKDNKGGTDSQPQDLRSIILTERVKSYMDLLAEQERLDEESNKRFRDRQEKHHEILTGLFKGYTQTIGAAHTDLVNQQLANDELQRQSAENTANARIEAAKAIAGALGALSELIGKQTAAGKALGIAQAAINMWIGVTEVLRAKSVIPEPFGTIAKVANVAVVIATGLNAIRNLTRVQVPGGGGGGQSVPAPLTPQIPQETRTRLNQGQINQIGNATVRAFVVETDIANNQERIRRLNRAARL